MKKIEITINPDGSFSADAKDFAGVACEKALREIETALAVKATKRVRKPEAYAKATVKIGK